MMGFFFSSSLIISFSNRGYRQSVLLFSNTIQKGSNMIRLTGPRSRLVKLVAVILQSSKELMKVLQSVAVFLQWFPVIIIVGHRTATCDSIFRKSSQFFPELLLKSQAISPFTQSRSIFSFSRRQFIEASSRWYIPTFVIKKLQSAKTTILIDWSSAGNLDLWFSECEAMAFCSITPIPYARYSKLSPLCKESTQQAWEQLVQLEIRMGSIFSHFLLRILAPISTRTQEIVHSLCVLNQMETILGSLSLAKWRPSANLTPNGLHYSVAEAGESKQRPI